MRIGCHISIAGGIEKSVIRAKKLGINTMQIFSKNSLTWQERFYDSIEIINFQKALQKTDIHPVFIHASYLINFASPDEKIYFKSINAFLEEMKRAEMLLANLGQAYLIVHPGAHRNAGEEYGLQRITRALKIILKQSSSLKLSTIILLENTSGSGSSLGYTFSQLRYIIEEIEYPEKIGICLDTCHAFAAGYNLAEEKGIEDTLTELDREINLDKLKVIHLNDSKYNLISRKDRHMHIGEGFIGLEGFRRLINHKSIRDLPFILETPKRSEEDDQRNISVIKRLRK
ncbi:MAG: deoxyribonuclease IV [Candidatus Atribacteria bacterium]|nr:deoxyribonuclease IV [Candidatus Atribacteria bacterium]